MRLRHDIARGSLLHQHAVITLYDTRRKQDIIIESDFFLAVNNTSNSSLREYHVLISLYALRMRSQFP